MDVTISEAGYKELVRGPVMRDMMRRGYAVQRAAKHNASGRPGPNVRTGRLRDSIEVVPGEDGVSVFVDVGSSLFYAPMVEFGHNNTAHAFPIMTPGGRFTGQFGYVSDAPTPAYPFLRPALVVAGTDS